jgi:NAD(P)H dehydrogenase (quinone)
MGTILVAYYSRTGNTMKMAEYIYEGALQAGARGVCKKIEDVRAADLLEYDGIIIGSPTYYGAAASAIWTLLDESVKHHGALDGKVGGAFSSSANIGGGNETTIVGILNALLIHGMVIQGDPEGDHYGPVSIGSPDERAKKLCLRFGERMAKLVQKLHPSGAVTPGLVP